MRWMLSVTSSAQGTAWKVFGDKVSDHVRLNLCGYIVCMSLIACWKFAERRVRGRSACLLATISLSLLPAWSQGTAPTFQYTTGSGSYVLVGHDPKQGGTTTIPTVLVPVTLSFETREMAGKPFRLDASADVPRVSRSPIFTNYRFADGGTTQYGDAMLRATFPEATKWHTVLGRPKVRPVNITVPAGYGYLLSSKKTGRFLGMVDLEFLQRELFKQIAKQENSLVIAVTHNTAYYVYGDATVCCSWGTHGVDSATGNSFVIGSYLQAAPDIVEDRDIQPLTEQIAEFINDPLRDPLLHYRPGAASNGNSVPAWMHPGAQKGSGRTGCGGTGIASAYVLAEPTDSNPRSELPVSTPFVATSGGTTWHLQNVALLPWYTGTAAGSRGAFSFPDRKVLASAAAPCPTRTFGAPAASAALPPLPDAVPGQANGHWLIGYLAGYENMPPRPGARMVAPPRLREVAPEWDVILVAFATPDKTAPEGTLVFHPRGLDAAQFKEDVAWLKSQGKKVMISLGGGGEYFSLDDPKSIPNFVSSVSDIIREYGFDGIDLDFESPSLVLDPGDTDFKHPKTPGIVNLIAGLRQLHDKFGPGFMISLVPEGTQMPAGFTSYGGQFGSYLPLLWGIRDILSFVDAQDYNTPPLEGPDGEIYQLGSVDYHVAMTELLLHGFYVGQDKKQFFPPVPADKVAVGFLVGATTPEEVSKAMDSIITGKAAAGARYKLRQAGGYGEMIGAMFWTINADRFGNYSFSNRIGPQLHNYSAVDRVHEAQ